MSFQTLGLSTELLNAIQEEGYTEPTQIQRQAIPLILQGGDIMGLAQTGTGKTASFTLPLLQLLTASAPENTLNRRSIRALILTPTRELAAQVAQSVKTYGKNLNLKSEVIFGGVSINPQLKAMRNGTDIVIATPGRLLDLVDQNAVDLSKVEILVLDEADRMLDMGFIRDIKRIIELLPKKRQNMLFSATLSADIQVIADSFLNKPQIIEVARRNLATALVSQVVYPVDRKRKRELLSWLIGSKNWLQVLVFTRTKHGANHLCEQLVTDGLTAAALHGNKSQGARTKALADFKSGKVRILVATDIAARGIDIDHLPFVVNFDLPNIPEDYVHRIGRTGRAGNEGVAVSLVCVDEKHLLRDIEKVLKTNIPQEIIVGYEVDPSIKAEPIVNGRRSSGAHDGGNGRGYANNHGNGEQRARAPYQGKTESARTYTPRTPRSHDAARDNNPHADDQRSYATRSAGAERKPYVARPNDRTDNSSTRTTYAARADRSEGNNRGANNRSDNPRPYTPRPEGSNRGPNTRTNDNPRPYTARPEGSNRGAGARTGENNRGTYTARTDGNRGNSTTRSDSPRGNNTRSVNPRARTTNSRDRRDN